MKYKVGNFIVKAPSKNINKKYDVFENGKFIVSYGDRNYQHYKDKLGYYSELDHNDKQRRKLYRKRHAKDKINNPYYAGYWAYNYLW